MRAFMMIREQDETGISGTGVVAEGIEYSDKTVAIRWLTPHNGSSTVVWNKIEDAIHVHGHNGKTQFVFTEEIRQ